MPSMSKNSKWSKWNTQGLGETDSCKKPEAKKSRDTVPLKLIPEAERRKRKEWEKRKGKNRIERRHVKMLGRKRNRER